MRKTFLYITCLILLTPTRLWALEWTPFLTLTPLNPVMVSGMELKNATTGASLGDASTDVGFGYFAAAGLMFNKKFGVEVEFGFVGADVSDIEGGAAQSTEGDKFDMTPLMVNVFYRSPGTLHSSEIFTLHYLVGGGAGMVKQNMSLLNLGTQGNDTVNAWQVLLGLELAPVHRSKFLNGSLLFQYKYFNSGEAQIDNVLTEIDTHSFSIGIRFF